MHDRRSDPAPHLDGGCLSAPDRTYLELLEQFEPRRPIENWIRFHRRRAVESGYRVEIRRRGDIHRGSVVIKLNRSIGAMCEVLIMVGTMEGSVSWVAVHRQETLPDALAERHLQRIARSDPDVWILEVAAERPC